jgi:hypothetical protein
VLAAEDVERDIWFVADDPAVVAGRYIEQVAGLHDQFGSVVHLCDGLAAEYETDVLDLRHTYATFALRAGVPVFAPSRFMGTSIAMIDLHYGHLAVDSYQHAVSLLDALALERDVDAGWTSARTPAKPHGATVSRRRKGASCRAVDARWTSKPRQFTTGRAEGAD